MLHNVAGVTKTMVTLPLASTVNTSSSKTGSVADPFPCIVVGLVFINIVVSVMLAGNWFTVKFCTVTLYFRSSDCGVRFLDHPALPDSCHCCWNSQSG